jgi:hypothetical protein
VFDLQQGRSGQELDLGRVGSGEVIAGNQEEEMNVIFGATGKLKGFLSRGLTRFDVCSYMRVLGLNPGIPAY